MKASQGKNEKVTKDIDRFFLSKDYNDLKKFISKMQKNHGIHVEAYVYTEMALKAQISMFMAGLKEKYKHKDLLELDTLDYREEIEMQVMKIIRRSTGYYINHCFDFIRENRDE